MTAPVAPVFDPRLFEVDPTDASVSVLLVMQKIWTTALAAGIEQGRTEGDATGFGRGHKQGFIEGSDHGVSQGLIRAKEIIEKEVHRGE